MQIHANYVRIIASVVAFLVVVILFQRCTSPLGNPVDPEVSDSYYHSKGVGDEIIYSPMGNWFELGKTSFAADAKTFHPLTTDIAVDKSFVYFGHKRQAHVDRASFHFASNKLADKHHVYYVSTDYTYNLVEVDGADPKTFEYLKGNDSSSNYRWAKDLHHYYLNHRPVTVDYPSFTFVTDNLMHDKLHVYFADGQLLVIKDTVTASIRRIDDHYATMGNTLFVVTRDLTFRKIKFDLIDDIKVRDADCIVVNKTLIVKGERFNPAGIDVATFESYPEWNYIYAHDNNQVYYEGRCILGADVKTFQILELQYAKDKHHVYYRDVIVPGANAATFLVRSGNKMEPTDGNHIYWEGKPIDQKGWEKM